MSTTSNPRSDTKPLILITGGAGYIGSHTIISLLENGFDVISIDNFSRSYPFILEKINHLTGYKIINYNIDLATQPQALQQVFENHPTLQGIIHFAAYKSVNESVRNPFLYYKNNLNSLLNLLQATELQKIKYFIFSSSCSVYGNATELPVTESTQLLPPQSPYAHTKQIGEQIIQHAALHTCPSTRFTLLRYFNPVGAHPSALIGELPLLPPENLVPIITQAAAGKRPAVSIYGNDYNTPDGTCLRDYIHVCDIANAHTLALQQAINQYTETTNTPQIFNLGTGNGISVLEIINAFEKTTNVNLPYQIAPRRAGDVEKIYANNEKAKKMLGWQPQFSVADMMQTAWEWQKKLTDF